MKLTNRDLRILALVAEQGFVTADQLKHEFPMATMTEVYRRLGELEEAELIVSERHLAHNRKLYLATRHLFSLLWGEANSEKKYSRPRTNQIAHDLKVTDVRIALQRVFPESTWTSEIELRRRAANKPLYIGVNPIGDGLLHTIEHGDFAIEVECTCKAQSRIREIMSGWLRNDEISMVLYVATEEQVVKTLQKVLKSVSSDRDRDRVGITRFQDLIAAQEKIPVSTSEGNRVLHTALFAEENQSPSKGVEAHGNPDQRI